MNEKVKQIQERLEKLPPANWTETVDENGDQLVLMSAGAAVTHLFFGNLEDTEKEDHWNATFVANAPADIRYLLAQNAELAAENARLELWKQTQTEEIARLKADVSSALSVIKVLAGEIERIAEQVGYPFPTAANADAIIELIIKLQAAR
jgi:hypothetical protein